MLFDSNNQESYLWFFNTSCRQDTRIYSWTHLNGYIFSNNRVVVVFWQEFDAVSRLGISDPKSYLKNRFGATEPPLFLSTLCVGQGLVDRVAASVEETLSAGDWIDALVSWNADSAYRICTGEEDVLKLICNYV